MKKLLAASLMALSVPAFACFEPPPEQYAAPDELISRTHNIVLAKVVSAETVPDSYSVSYTFRSIRALKGQASAEFTITGHPANWEGEDSAFNHHSDKEFWSTGIGRSTNDTDCQIYPTFSVGGTYLVFLDRPYHAKSFELIIRTHGDAETRDKWLQHVETRTGP